MEAIEPGVPQFHRGIQLPGEVSRRVSRIKVNQLREVVEEILTRASRLTSVGSGQQAGVVRGLALQSHQGCFIICNGYKDAEFIRMALLGRKLGKRVIMVVEKLEMADHRDFEIALAWSRLVGIRARLLSKGAGRWAESGGENAKFGLSTTEILAATEMLKADNLGHCLKLLHFLTSARRCRIFWTVKGGAGGGGAFTAGSW